MAVVVLILLAVAGAFAHWLGRGPGARALALFRRESKPLLAPVALVFGQIVVEAIPPGLAAPFFTGSVSTLTVGLSLPFMLWVALEVTVRSWLVR
ncbi:MAG: hypothetical protein ACAI25_07480, partial [Planctomycetota bacterium]